MNEEVVPGLAQELAFAPEEYQRRIEGVRAEIRRRGLDALLVHHPPNVLYLSGYQTFNVYDRECLLLPAEGEPLLLVPEMERGTARLHSWLPDVAGFARDGEPAALLARALAERGLDAARIGVELHSAALSAARYAALRAALPAAELVDGSGLVERVKRIKSPAEIAHLRRAAAITDAGMRAAIGAAAAGQTDNDVAAAAYAALMTAGSEYMCLDPVVTSGRRAGILHSTHKRVRLARGDAVAIELGACFQRYSAPLMRTLSLGPATPCVERLARACLSALDRVLAVLRPGISADDVARAGEEGIALAGPGLVFHGIFGEAVGAGFPPTWVEGTELLVRGGTLRLEASMVFHLPIALRDLGQCGTMFSETVLITPDGCEVLTGLERQLFIR